ncbi:expressed unknown protein [Seminavis robusta]|uniref:Uncharacterized protein n=1 Tax=Seminavis robusta TaxID=568900 RepID=A0A9N8D6M2_9STRA|nr:expressed unknown protein [Seminavis robusta]|eukprot:Sro13_g010340.1 n/a (719) ;mRNA; f:186751-188907
MSRRFDLECKGVVLSMDEKYGLSITDSKPLPLRMPAPPSNQRDARRQLGSFLRNGRMESRYSQEHHGRISDILQTYPALATTLFGNRRHDRALPFHHVVGAKGVALSLLQTLLRQHPQAIYEFGGQGGLLPLHYACHACADATVIQWLIEQNPQAVTTPCQSNKERLPLHYAVTKYNTSLETLSLLVQACPDKTACWTTQDNRGFSVLNLAVLESCKPSMVEHLVRLLPSTTETPLDLHLKLSSSGDVYKVNSSVLESSLTMVLPHVTRVTWDLSNSFWRNSNSNSNNQHNFVIIQCLQNWYLYPSSCDDDTSLSYCAKRRKRASLRVITPKTTNDNQPWDTVVSLLSPPAGKPILRHLQLGPSHDVGHHLLDASNLWQMCLPLQLETMELQEVTFNCQSLANLLGTLTTTWGRNQQESKPLRGLKLTLAQLEDQIGMPDARWDLNRISALNNGMNNPWRHSQLERLSLWNCLILEHHILRRLLLEISHMPRLTQLEVVFRSHVHPTSASFETEEEEELYWQRYSARSEPMFHEIDNANVTPEIVTILRQGRLQALTLEGPSVDVEALADVLLPVLPPRNDNNDAVQHSSLQKLWIPSSLDENLPNLKAFSNLLANNFAIDSVVIPKEKPHGGDVRPNDEELRRLEQKIVYFAALNRSGRAQIVDGGRHPSMADFVKRLASIGVDDVCIHSDTCHPGNVEVYQILYGVLRFAPGLWSS